MDSTARVQEMKRWWPLLLVVVLGAGYVVASPFVTYHQLRTAADQRDAEALAEHVDFPAVRQDLKDQLNAEASSRIAEKADNDALAVLGGLLASVVVDRVVESLVTPSGLAELMKGEIPKTGKPAGKRRETTGRQRADRVRYGYASWDKFVVTVPDKASREVRFILRRRGLGWKLTAIKLPLGE
jgi:hypothetical protein